MITTPSPTPWTNSGPAVTGDKELLVRDCNGILVAAIPHLGRTDAEQAANAWLIAAAPQLLRALELAHYWLTERAGERPSGVAMQEIRLALARAKASQE